MRHRLALGRGDGAPVARRCLCTTGINVLALTGPLYMLLLYDFVLPAHAGGKLLALTAADAACCMD